MPTMQRPTNGVAYIWPCSALPKPPANSSRRASSIRCRLFSNRHVAWGYYVAGHYDQAIEQYRKTLDFPPEYIRALIWLGFAYELRGMKREAKKLYERAGGPANKAAVALLGRLAAEEGHRKEAFRIIHEVMASYVGSGSNSPHRGRIHLRGRNRDSALPPAREVPYPGAHIPVAGLRVLRSCRAGGGAAGPLEVRKK